MARPTELLKRPSPWLNSTGKSRLNKRASARRLVANETTFTWAWNCG